MISSFYYCLLYGCCYLIRIWNCWRKCVESGCWGDGSLRG